MQLSLLTAFLGGVLALLSPCGALLLPAFFASSLGRRLRVAGHGLIFYAGLVVTLVPLGLGLGALGSLLVHHRDVLIATTSIVLLILGLLQAAGFGFELAKLLPGAVTLQQRAHQRHGVTRTFLLGAASGVAGFCAGPILGAILTLAMARGNTLEAGLLLASYGLGMVVPLVILASVWSRLKPRALGVLRGRAFTVAGRQFHSTSVVTGLLIALVGVVFWATNGLVTMPSLIPASVLAALQSYSGVLASPIVDAAVIVTGIVVGVIARGIRRTRRQTTDDQPARRAP